MAGGGWLSGTGKTVPPDHVEAMINGNSRREGSELRARIPELQPFEEQHFPIAYWSRRWGFSEKTVREWFRETGPGILRHQNVGRRKKRDYTTMMISPTAAARVYAKRTAKEPIH